MTGARTEAAQFVYDRFTMSDDLRSPGDPIRRHDPAPCCHGHTPGRVCILPAGHR